VTYLVDTNVISEGRKQRPDPGVARWIADVASSELFLSVLVLGEIAHGIERLRRRNDDVQADAIAAWVATVKTTYAERVLPVTAAVAERWGRFSAARPLPPIDGLLAATALEHGLTLVTRDTRSLARTGVALLDPWQRG
jgi:predicted nucleic acid-binding protein